LQTALRLMMSRLLVAGLLSLATVSCAYAHLMVAQRGTLNIVGDGAFMVLSLPVSAFSGVDDDRDGKLSTVEFVAHRLEIIAAVTRNVQLLDAQGARPLEGLMLSLAPPDDAPHSPATQLVVLGRFALPAGTTDAATLDSSLRFRVTLFGKATLERSFQITVTRKLDKQLMTVTPDHSQRALLPSRLSVFTNYVELGAEHIVTGFDHLLFLLVVLSAGWGWRYLLVAITTFTAGHALTLAISVLCGVTAPASIVEPTIAATIVGVALFDIYARRREQTLPPWLRLSLIFVCSLIHGLGLASVLNELGLDGQHRLVSLGGFNVGMELAQLAAAGAIVITAMAVRRMRGEMSVIWMARFASLAAIAVSSGWFVQRVLSIA
jgi:hypothetical protein